MQCRQGLDFGTNEQFKINAQGHGNRFDYRVAVLVSQMWTAVFFFLLSSPAEEGECVQSFLEKCLLFAHAGPSKPFVLAAMSGLGLPNHYGTQVWITAI